MKGFSERCVYNIFKIDLSNYIKENNILVYKNVDRAGQEKDVFFYTGSNEYFRKLSVQLNKKLNIHKINKQWLDL